MAPKGKAKAKAAAKAAAAERRKSAKRAVRRDALKELNALADDVGAARAAVDPREAPAQAVERAIHILEARCREPPLSVRLRAIVVKWVANGGQLQAELAPAPDSDSAATVPFHKVLAPEFRLQSRAFMMTYNSRSLRPEMWIEFRTFVASLKERLGARAWAANLEESLHAAPQDDEATARFHCHAYLLWTDGVGISRQNLDDFLFRRMRPRIDVCTSQRKHMSPMSAACHGLWYVSTLKAWPSLERVLYKQALT